MAIGTKKSEDNLPVVIGCLVVFGVLFGSASGAPNPISSEPWWINACRSFKDPHRSTTTQFPTRHSRSAQETQLRTFIKKTEFFVNDFKNIYPKVPNYTSKRSLRWLPIKKMQQELNKSGASFYQAFHANLQKFAIYMDFLRKIRIKTDIKFEEKARAKIYDNATDQLKLVLCEFQDLLDKKNLKAKDLRSIKEIGGRKSLPKLGEKIDLTQVQIMDVQFFIKMGTYLRRTQRDLRRALRKDRKHRRKVAKSPYRKMNKKKTLV